jgi:hypothetical protein
VRQRTERARPIANNPDTVGISRFLEASRRMNYIEDEYNIAKSDMLRDVNKAILDAEELRKTETAAPGCPKAEPETAGTAPTGTGETGEPL